jgi:hypothetical protein
MLGVIDMVDETELRHGNFDLIAIGQFAQRILGYAGTYEALLGEFVLEAALDAAIQFRPFFLGYPDG